jgi:ATP-dependent DNA helicase RecG
MNDHFSRASENPLAVSAQYVKGVGPLRFEKLLKLGLCTVGDLLYYLPRTYEYLVNRERIADLKANEQIQTIVAEVVEIKGRMTASGKEMTSIILSDGGPVVLEAIYFNQSYIANKLRYGEWVSCTGKPRHYHSHWKMDNPRLSPVDQGKDGDPGTAILPSYALTEGLHPDAMRRIEREIATRYAPAVSEIVPSSFLHRHKLGTAAQALQAVHLPRSLDEAEQGRRRLAYEELIVLQVALALQRREHQIQHKATPLFRSRLVDERIRKLLPFQLTKGQERAIRQICEDMAKDHPMRRLLQADVGAGKTAVAVYAMLVAVANKHQTALMAPTEVLARQHWRTLQRYLANSRVKMELLVGGLSEKKRRLALDEIRRGQIDLVIGTQALIEKDIDFAKLGLVVIDEQHRFGVMQRATIRHKGLDPHYLVMTATPIPRTIALTVFGDLDVSVVKELPPGRQPVITRLVDEEQRPLVMQELVRLIKEGQQCFFICPRVEESAELDLKGATDTCQMLKDGPFRNLRVGLMHGRLDDRLKDETMAKFRERELDVLVATTVVEVGVDVPNATLMVIEHAERFGLSQLHQLRGRVSRGNVAGQCYLFTTVLPPEAKERLFYFSRTTDGFLLAEKDLELRGGGEFFGTRQHGASELKVAHPIRDAELLGLSRQDARELVKEDPDLRKFAHAGIRAAVTARYGKVFALASIG